MEKHVTKFKQNMDLLVTVSKSDLCARRKNSLLQILRTLLPVHYVS